MSKTIFDDIECERIALGLVSGTGCVKLLLFRIRGKNEKVKISTGFPIPAHN